MGSTEIVTSYAIDAWKFNDAFDSSLQPGETEGQNGTPPLPSNV